MRKRTLLISVAALLLTAAGLGLLTAVVLQRYGAPRPAYLAETSSVLVSPTPEPAAGAPRRASTDPRRLLIPRIAVDATLVTLGVDPDGSMQTPTHPMDVAWYRFSAKPGQSGNIVMAGHVDYLNFGPAVFYRLRDLKVGDEVFVETDDGMRFAYRVAEIALYEDVPEAVAKVTASTSAEVLTLITCDGNFNRTVRQYDRRLVVRAERM